MIDRVMMTVAWYLIFSSTTVPTAAAALSLP